MLVLPRARTRVVSNTFDLGNWLESEEISFAAGHLRFTGRVNGVTIDGVGGSGVSRSTWRRGGRRDCVATQSSGWRGSKR
jgi:hypothetical protein